MAAERLVADRLVAAGWAVVARNWRGARGELDVVVVRDGRLRFVEVKARAAQDEGGIEAVGAWKQRRLVRAARAFLASWPEPVAEACFTVVVVTLPPRGSSLEHARVEWIDDAFDA